MEILDLDCVGLGYPIIHFIKRKEKELGRVCRRVWTGTNPQGQIFIFGRFCKKWDRLIVTVAYKHKELGFMPAI